MDRKEKIRTLIFPVLAIMILTFNFSRMEGTESFKSIHIVTLIGIGMCIGIVLRNIILMIKGH